ncbi:MAG: bifunctional folylpolyglutamate synthase/dihydrofolate synthase [Verrucomicrobiales bacterium]|nr:bifunctional folylpolyglutamate synthase/dihydrofolate synthase [Verrucomicrobiales bacterium]
MDYQESIDWLYGTQLFGIKLGLENVTSLLEETSVTQDLEGRKIVHVAGTNGKGSVCAFTERILRDAGLKTGLFTSPHLVAYSERIQIDGEKISEERIAGILTDIRDRVNDWDPHPTFFEISLALALRYFCDEGCEVILLETGMGGRLDATNAVDADVSVITSIGLDHQQWLGETIREIAAEKAGIIKPTIPVIVADLHPDARDVVGRRALTLGVPYIEAHPLPDEWLLGLKGPHQRENAALAVEAACRVEGDRLTQEGIQQSLAEASWPGRFEVVGDRLVLDGAHNEAAAEALRAAWQETFPGESAHLIFGAAESKDLIAIFKAILPVIGSVTFVPIQSERRVSAGEMTEAFLSAGGESENVKSAENLSEALEIGEGKVLVAGSLFLVGEARSIVEGGDFEVSLQ